MFDFASPFASATRLRSSRGKALPLRSRVMPVARRNRVMALPLRNRVTPVARCNRVMVVPRSKVMGWLRWAPMAGASATSR